METSPELIEYLLRLLDSTGELVKIVKQIKDLSIQVAPANQQANDTFSSCSSIGTIEQKVFSFHPSIHLSLAANINPELARCLQDHQTGSVLLQEFVWLIARFLKSEEITHMAQVSVTPVITGLAFVEEYRTGSRKNF